MICNHIEIDGLSVRKPLFNQRNVQSTRIKVKPCRKANRIRNICRIGFNLWKKWRGTEKALTR